MPRSRATDALFLALAAVIHVALLWSVIAQPLDGRVPPRARRFATFRLHFDATSFPGPAADFFALYHAGVQSGRGQSPYDQRETPRVTPYFFKFIYSPAIADTLGRLAASLPPVTAFRVWIAIIEASLIACIVAFWSTTTNAAAKAAGTALLLASQPFVLELHMGQFTFVATALTLLAATLTEKTDKRRFDNILAGPFLLCAGLLKTFPFLALPAFARRRRGAPVAIAAVGGILAVAAWTWLGHGGGRYASAFALVDPFDGPHPGTFSLLQTLFLVWLAFTRTWLPVTLPLLPLFAMVAILAWTAWQVLRWERDDVVLPTALLLVAFFLGFLHVWEHHYSAVLLAGVFILGRLADSPASPPQVVPMMLCTLALIAAPTPYVLFPAHPSRWSIGAWLLMSLSKAAPATVLYVTGLRALRVSVPVAEPSLARGRSTVDAVLPVP